eukprot:TRINITY_DN5116_c0_g1_i3.p1 TRINITY_DN5116_c0_g1~~TRINITY_DN5116_c0_g1_i3.p1  ORF type:complete len:247 (+),score=51.59 TRINITY_DN5116_c0_g1_i3:69-809(+)
MADTTSLLSYESTAGGGYQQQEIAFAPKRSSLEASAALASTQSAPVKEQRPDASSASLKAFCTSSTLRPMPPSNSAPGRRRPNFHGQGRSRLKFASEDLPAMARSLNELPVVAADAERGQGRSQLKFASEDLPAMPQSLNELPPAAADAELQARSSGSLPDAIPPRARARQRQRFFGPALAWSYRQQRDMSRTLDFSDLLRQPPTPDEREEDSDSDASSIGSDLELDKDPEAISMRDLLQSKWSAG